jgi:hypothetical protein
LAKKNDQIITWQVIIVYRGLRTSVKALPSIIGACENCNDIRQL